MPRRSKGARLWLRPGRRDKAGKITRRAIWLILDGGKHIATGCAAGEAERAEQILATYIAEKYRPDRRGRDLDAIDVADVLSVYVDDCAHRHANQQRFRARIARLNEFWGGMTLAGVTGGSCRRYAKHRGNPGGARRDLEDLRAAINHHAKEGLHRGIVRIVLPDKGLPRDRWLTRSEAARLLWACWRTREIQTPHRGARKGTRGRDRSLSVTSHRAVYFDGTLYWNPSTSYNDSVIHPRTRQVVRRPGARHFLSLGGRKASHQQTPAPGAITATAPRANAELGASWDC